MHLDRSRSTRSLQKESNVNPIDCKKKKNDVVSLCRFLKSIFEAQCVETAVTILALQHSRTTENGQKGRTWMDATVVIAATNHLSLK